MSYWIVGNKKQKFWLASIGIKLICMYTKSSQNSSWGFQLEVSGRTGTRARKIMDWFYAYCAEMT
jgi:hypothetical protein